jgi:hypothetical protein
MGFMNHDELQPTLTLEPCANPTFNKTPTLTAYRVFIAICCNLFRKQDNVGRTPYSGT